MEESIRIMVNIIRYMCGTIFKMPASRDVKYVINKLLGVIPMVIKHGKSETRQFVYITKEKSDFLLPFQALCDLGILSKIGQQS